jgi:hypothetical protein
VCNETLRVILHLLSHAEQVKQERDALEQLPPPEQRKEHKHIQDTQAWLCLCESTLAQVQGCSGIAANSLLRQHLGP